MKDLQLTLQEHLNDVAWDYHMTLTYDSKISALKELDFKIDYSFDALSLAYDMGNLTDTAVRRLAKQAVINSEFDRDSQEITTQPNLRALFNDIRETA